MSRLDKKVRKRIKEIRNKYATRFKKLDPEITDRTAKWKTIQEPKSGHKLYGQIRIENRGSIVLLIYSIVKSWNYVFSPNDYDDKGKLKRNAQPISKEPVVEEIVEEIK